MDKTNQKLDQYAKNIIKMEDDIDYSMEGYFMEDLMKKYIENKYQKILDMFNQIYTEQTETRDSYGDNDFSITKVECVNIPDQNETYPSEFRAIQLVCLCGDESFYILTETSNFGGLQKEELRIIDCTQKLQSKLEVNKTNSRTNLGVFSATRISDEIHNVNFKPFIKKPTESFTDVKMVLSCLKSIQFSLDMDKEVTNN
jgi:hypothetical protein